MTNSIVHFVASMRPDWKPGKRALFAGTMALALPLLLGACRGSRSAAARDAVVMSKGKALYQQNCAECHGANGEGQPNWKEPDAEGIYPAPPHDSSGHTWHHPDDQLLEIIAGGGTMPGSPMAGFAGTLSEEEMRLTLDYIKTFWGAEDQDYQEQVTRQYQELNQ